MIRTAHKWLVGEAFSALKDTSNVTARQDIAKRFPLFATAPIEDILAACDSLGGPSVRRIESVLNGKRAARIEAKAAKKASKAAKKGKGTKPTAPTAKGKGRKKVAAAVVPANTEEQDLTELAATGTDGKPAPETDE